MYAWHNDPVLMERGLAQIDNHVLLDQVRNGSGYWDGSNGCFIGCLGHSHDPQDAEDLTGWPPMLLRIAENIFEALPQDDAVDFFKRCGHAPRLGADLSLVSWKFLYRCVTDASARCVDKKTKDGCAATVNVLRIKSEGGVVTYAAARAAAADAAADAYAAARADADAARAAAYAADAADDADARKIQAEKLIELLEAA